VFGYLFRFFDGFLHILKVSGPLGLELDSLADMVTSGVVPGYVMFFMLSNSQHEISTHFMLPWIHYHDGFLLPFGCIQHRYPSDEFIHWFTDSNALFILSLP
jgi:CDP-diacylglycerol--serine O-phosphatidyltransferase